MNKKDILVKSPFGEAKGAFLFQKMIFFVPLWLRVGCGLFLLASPVFAESLEQKLGKWFSEGRTLEAQQALSHELEKNPSRLDLWLESADLRKSQGDYAGAVAAYRSYLAQKDEWKVRVALDLALEQKGDIAEARESLLELSKKHPDDPDILWGMARLCLAQSKWKSLRTQPGPREALKESQSYLLKLTSLKPDFALATWQLAEVSRLLGDGGKALKAYEKVVKEDGSFKLAHRYMAELYEQNDQYSKALAKYDQAMAVQPDDKELKKEASDAAAKAPRVYDKRQAERLKQWEKWTPPEETIIAPSPVTIRVGIFLGMGHLLFRGGSDLRVTTPANNPITVLKAKTNYQAVYYSAQKSRTHKEYWAIEDVKGKELVTFSQRIWVIPQDPKTVILHAVPSNPGYFFAKEEDRAYRGVMEFSPRSGAGFNVLNRVSLEDYLAGVLPAEMNASWPMEALKAQAVVARTYVLSKMGRHNDDGFDVCDGVHCQVYRGLRAENERTNESIRQTAGQVLRHNGKVMTVAFSAQCGGHTQDYEEAWGGKNAVVGVKDYEDKYNQDMDFPLSPHSLERWIIEDRVAYCRAYHLKGYRNYRWGWIVSANYLEKKANTVGRIRRLLVTHRSTAGWADHLLVEGDKGSKEYKADSIRGFLGGIRSNLIWIEPQFDPKGWPEEFLVYGGGWGHGVGMCQVGTYGLAEAGKDCKAILKHYFPKGNVERLESK